ncbi:MAG: hypothetical protein ACREMX_15680 [Gemmatimonadales bacterium]
MTYGRPLFWLLALGGIAVVAATASRVPAAVATHFDAGGTPIAWSSHGGYLFYLAVFGLVLPLGLIAMVNLVGSRGPERFNLPHRAYWLRPDNRASAVARVQSYMWWLGCVLTAAVVTLHLLIVRANATSPPQLRTRPFFSVLGLILLGIASWIAGWFRVFRPPPIA